MEPTLLETELGDHGCDIPQDGRHLMEMVV